MSSSKQAPAKGSEQQPTFKEQLDQAAHEARHPRGKSEEAQPSLVEKGKFHGYCHPSASIWSYIWRKECKLGLIRPPDKKVTEYIPAAAKILGTDKTEEKTPAKDISGPPERPKHDGHIEEFVRDQHRSKRQGPESTHWIRWLYSGQEMVKTVFFHGFIGGCIR